MAHALVDSGILLEIAALPQSARRLDDGDWVLGLADADVALVEATGWFPVVEIYAPLGANQHHGPPVYNVFPDHVDANYPAVADDIATVNRTEVLNDVTAAMVQLQGIISAGPIIGGGAGLPAVRTAVLLMQTQVQLEALMLRKIIRTIIGDYTGAD